MNVNPFVLNPENYKRDLNIMGHYVKDASTYLSKMTGRSVEECGLFIRKSLAKGGEFQFRDPVIQYTERDDKGDRELKEGTLYHYLTDSIKAEELIAPTLTTYLPHKRKQSLLVDFIDGNIKARSVAKKAMFKAKMAGDKPTETIKKLEQNNKKTSNNSLSGAHVSASTPLYNKTAHSTLTSNCRSTSGYGNANNEKFLCGNRHYWSPIIVKNNIISIINNTDLNKLQRAMDRYGIRHPTIDETYECVTYSAQLYWKGKNEYSKIYTLISKLSDIERSAFVYIGDLYHLKKFNDSPVREFITKLSTRVVGTNANAKQLVSDASDDIKSLASQICVPEMKGKTIKDTEDTPAYEILACTIENINHVIEEYAELIDALWTTPNVPASMAFFPDSIRRAAITSDTDSTIFTVQDWVIWHQGKLGFDQSADAVAAAVIFLASQTIIHVLAKMSANFGIPQDKLFKIAMKNEFKFPVFVPTSVAKHYFALISCQEGNVFNEFDKEIKGVHLKSSNAPKEIIKEAHKLMEFIMYSVIEGKQISINNVIKRIAKIEHGIIDSIQRGSHEYFRLGQIKTSASYKNGEDTAAFLQYSFWQDVFGPKYGMTPEPPYTTVKLSVDLDTPSKTKAWLMGLEDKELADRAQKWMDAYGKKHLGSTFMLPEQLIASKGIPAEILSSIGIRRMVLDCSRIFYLILETLGVFMLNDKITRLCSDIVDNKNSKT